VTGYPMTTNRSTRKLAVILHADVMGLTGLYQLPVARSC
jgi:hypothetical protein